MKKPPHPDQPVYIDKEGKPRFRGNKIVRYLYLLDAGGIDMNKLAFMPSGTFKKRDWDQFYQLIGYDVVGILELSDTGRVTEDMANRAVEAAYVVIHKSDMSPAEMCVAKRKLGWNT